MAKKYEVTKGSLYLRVNGKLQELAAGTEVTLDEAAAKSLLAAGKLADPKAKPQAKVDAPAAKG